MPLIQLAKGSGLRSPWLLRANLPLCQPDLAIELMHSVMSKMGVESWASPKHSVLCFV